MATGAAAGCAHAAALMCDDDLRQEAAGQLSEMRMIATIRRLWCRTKEQALRVLAASAGRSGRDRWPRSDGPL